MRTPFDTYREANARLDELIDSAPPDRSLAAITARAQNRLRRTARFMERLGEPHHSAPVIHVAGTSGKGSTAIAIAHILQAAGYRTLLHTSPYLQVAVEKLTIDGQLLHAETFAELVERALAEMTAWGEASLTYGEAWMGVIGLTIERFRPDVAIVEVGAGGRFDLTNLVRSEVAVITSIGLDHTETLGGTIEEIAWHKAGIIKPGSAVVHAVDVHAGIAAIERQADEVGAPIHAALDLARCDPLPEPDGHWSWRDERTGQRLTSGLPGRIQAQNGALAVAAARAWRENLPIEAIRKGLATTRFPARFERMPGDRKVILDGAHNPQKVSALVPELARLPRPRIGVLGFLAAKRADEMIAHLAPHLDGIILTIPDVVGKPGLDLPGALDLARSLARVPVEGVESQLTALELAVEHAGRGGSVLVTGSLFLCGAVRERWYSSEAIVAQQTPWPSSLTVP